MAITFLIPEVLVCILSSTIAVDGLSAVGAFILYTKNIFIQSMFVRVEQVPGLPFLMCNPSKLRFPDTSLTN